MFVMSSKDYWNDIDLVWPWPCMTLMLLICCRTCTSHSTDTYLVIQLIGLDNNIFYITKIPYLNLWRPSWIWPWHPMPLKFHLIIVECISLTFSHILYCMPLHLIPNMPCIIDIFQIIQFLTHFMAAILEMTSLKKRPTW